MLEANTAHSPRPNKSTRPMSQTSPAATSSGVVVRFAPSPTGFLHIGGARTALFNWLYARGRGGKFLLRIEDTDRERNSPEAVDAILDGLKWLELDWDGEAVSQFARAGRHREVAEAMLASGHAYRCYSQPAEIEAAREAVKAENQSRKEQGRSDFLPELYLSPWRDRPASEAPDGVRPAIRLKAPRVGETIVADHVQGRVTFPNKDLDDLIILRSDGNPTYNLAVVVDDHDMGVTHVIRGVDHLTNAARQTQIYEAMGWAVPEWAHVPLIHGSDGAKLSKRHGALGVEAYRAMGYLPAALRNYLVRLGWSHGDDEIIPTAQLIEWFDLGGIGKSAARFDFAKLEALNGHYIRNSSDDDLFDRLSHLLPFLPHGEEIAEAMAAGAAPKLRALMPALKERAKTLLDLLDQSAFLWADRPLKLDDKAAKLIDADARAALRALLAELAGTPDWSAASLEAKVRVFAEEKALKLGKIAQPLRAALTGSAVSPPVFDVMAVLGEEEALARIRDQAG